MIEQNVAIFGLGVMGEVMVRAFDRAPGWRPVLIVDPSQHARARASLVAPGAQVAGSEDEALSRLRDLKVGVVAIATPPDGHERLAVAAIESGHHVLCEKPLARDAGEAKRMADAAARHPQLLAVVNLQTRFTRARSWLRETIASGVLGPIRHIAVKWNQPSVFSDPWTWSSASALGGGVLNEFGSHIVDILIWMLGAPPTHASGVTRTAVGLRVDRSGVERKVTSDDIATFRLVWADGMYAQVDISGLALPRDRKLEVHGDRGSVLVDADDIVVWTRRTGELERLDLSETEPSLIGDPADRYSQPFARLIGEIRACLLSGTAPKVAANFNDALRMVQVLDAVRKGAPTEIRYDDP